MSTVNKEQLVAAVAEKTGMSKAKAAEAINAVLETIQDTVRKGNKLTLVGFGSFSAKNRAAREGRNPVTGEKISIKAKRVPAAKLTFAI